MGWCVLVLVFLVVGDTVTISQTCSQSVDEAYCI